MENNIRIFTKEDKHYNSIEVLKLSNNDIVKVAYFSNQGYTFIIEEGREDDIQSYREIGGLSITEDEIKNSKVFTEDEVSSEFIKLIMDEETEITEDETKKEIEKIKAFDNAIDWVELTETYTYWDGSNHKTIELNSDCSDWQEVDEEDISDFEIEEILDSEEKGTCKEKIIMTKSGKKAIITISFYQGEISDTWEFIE